MSAAAAGRRGDRRSRTRRRPGDGRHDALSSPGTAVRRTALGVEVTRTDTTEAAFGAAGFTRKGATAA